MSKIKKVKVPEEDTKKMLALPLAQVIYNMINYNKMSGATENGFTIDVGHYQVDFSVKRKRLIQSN